MALPAEFTAGRSRPWWRDRSAWSPATALGLAAAAAWVIVVRRAVAMPPGEPMSMHPATFSAGGAASSVAAWGVMMAAMMLPSAIPMVALYHAVNGVMAGHPHRRISPTAVFVAPYVLIWLAVGLPVYVASVLVSAAARAYDWMVWLVPYAVAAVLAGAGVYQLSAAKRACLRACRTPLDLLPAGGDRAWPARPGSDLSTPPTAWVAAGR
jgi:predicted metal-binding membrane protein